MVKALFIYSGVDRRKLEEAVKKGTDPDTSFFGFMEVKKDKRIEASYIQINKETYTFAGGFIRKYMPLRVLYLYFKFRAEFSSADVIVLASSAYFDLMHLKKMGLLKLQKFIILNLDLNIAIKSRKNTPSEKRLLSLINNASKIICVSKAQKEFLLSKGIPNDKTAFISLGVDKNYYKPISSTGEFVLTIGRDTGRDFETFIEAIRLSGEQAVMICSPKNIEDLKDKIPPNLEILFDLPYQELGNFYKRAKVFVIATKPGELLIGSDCPGQTAILDTMAYGIPVVATYMPWFEGYFEEGKNIVTVPSNNPRALANGFKKVILNNELSKRLSKEGRELIDQTCNSGKMGKRIAELILNSA